MAATLPGRRRKEGVVLVGDILRWPVPSVREHTVLAVAADRLVECGLGTLPVLDPLGRLTGVVSEGDVLRFVVGDRQHPLSGSGAAPGHYRPATVRHVVADVMTRTPVTVDEGQPVEEVARMLVRVPWRVLPVVRDGRLVGLVVRTDVVAGLIGETDAPVAAPGGCSGRGDAAGPGRR